MSAMTRTKNLTVSPHKHPYNTLLSDALVSVSASIIHTWPYPVDTHFYSLATKPTSAAIQQAELTVSKRKHTNDTLGRVVINNPHVVVPRPH